MKLEIKRYAIALTIFFAFVFYSEVALIPLMVMNIDYDSLSLFLKMGYNIVYECSFIFIIFLIYKEEIISNFKDFKDNIQTYIQKYLKYWFLILGLMYAANFIILLFNNGIAQNEEAVRSLMNNHPIFAFIISVVFAPILEELVFRKTLRKIFKTNFLYIFISGFTFGFMHVINHLNTPLDLLYLIPYSIPGWIFAYLYLKSKNIFIPIGIHFIHNGILTIIQILLMFI